VRLPCDIIKAKINKKDEYSDLTRRIIGICFEVHRELGPGFKEKTYANALKIGLRKRDIKYLPEKSFKVHFQNEQVGEFRVDLLVENKVIVEIKAIENRMPKIFEAQLISYLKASRLRVGLLINFGNKSCEVRRLMS